MEPKVIFLGSANAGKTTIIGTYRDGTFFRQTNPTLGIDTIKIKHSSELTIQVYIIYVIQQYWDTAGEEKYNSVNFTHIKMADGIVLVYDPAEENEELKKNLNYWLETIEKNSDILEKNDGDYLWLVGNNKDNGKEINLIDEQKRIKDLGLKHIQIKDHRIIVLNGIEKEIKEINVNYSFLFLEFV